MTTVYIPLRRYHRIDGWRGYPIPRCAVLGASDTGTWSDSPCPSPKVKAEIAAVARKVLRPLGIKYRTGFGGSSNAFCAKRWVRVSPADFNRAASAMVDYQGTDEWRHLDYVHDADLEKCAIAEAA